jgi:glycosyltransferase involved in cell wall biosynthesis
MNSNPDKIRVLYSFPHKIGASRICYTAWQQVSGLIAAGADVSLFPGALGRPAPPDVKVWPTLARGKFRLPYRLLGRLRTLELHDYFVARRIEKMVGQIDIIHTWPLGALHTLKAAARLGIPTVLERPNAHTRFAYEVVKKECDRLGVALPADHEHAYNPEILRIEEEEYKVATRLLCPSEFVVKTFLDYGFEGEQLARHFYGVDEGAFYPQQFRDKNKPFTMIFVGVCAVRKGLHFALEAWLKSPASKDGRFLIAGSFVPVYEEKLRPMLSHPSVQVLGHRDDVGVLMRDSDAFVLPTIEEGFGLVCTEAMASGSVPIVSEACTEFCRHMENALVHRIGDVEELTRSISLLYEDRALLAKMRDAGLRTIPEITWTAAGARLLSVYQETIEMYQDGQRRLAPAKA